jgi:hypothetical protein
MAMTRMPTIRRMRVSSGQLLGQQRMGGDLSIAVDPNDSATV